LYISYIGGKDGTRVHFETRQTYEIMHLILCMKWSFTGSNMMIVVVVVIFGAVDVIG
jgi:hypothetical protein